MSVAQTAPSVRQGGTPSTADIDVRALAAELSQAIEGEVRFDDGSRALYARDAGNYRQTPIGVVVPKSTKDVVLATSICRRFGAPIVPRGAGTSLAGQACNAAVSLDFSKYLHGVLEIDAAERRARVQPGVPLDDLREAAEEHRLTFGPDPATHPWCTLGGMIGNNSCGVHSVMAGRTEDNIEELEVITYDGLRLRVGPTSDEQLAEYKAEAGRRGEIYRRLDTLRQRYEEPIRRRFPDIPRRVSGYNLDELLPDNGFNIARALVGTEGTCITVLEATVSLIESPPARVLLVLGYADVYTAADDVPAVLEQNPVGLEGMDDRLVGYMDKKGLHAERLGVLPDGRGWLLAEFGAADTAEAEAHARAAAERLQRRRDPAVTSQIYVDPDDQHYVWTVRESGLGATAFVPGMDDTWPGWEDSAVPPARLGSYLRDLRGLMDKFGYGGSFYGHFGQGCVHTRMNFELESASGRARFRSFIEQAAGLVVGHGGSLSGEHGDGQARAELLHKMYGRELVEAFREFKSIWDPEGRMNPGKVVDPRPLDADVTLAAERRVDPGPLHFRYPDDQGDFFRAGLRCVGVGKCRDVESGTMCPSYQVLREEKHTTRGRAHLLHEMLVGETISGGWRSDEVKEALDLCLGCKGCKGDCPVNVDVGTYKAEFMAHYYSGRLRPRAAYAFGLIFYWARLAALAPQLANVAAHLPGVGQLAKALAGIDQRRDIPRFAEQTFRGWFHDRPPPRVAGPPVVLWVDTFTNYLQPRVAQSAVAVLEAAGRRVIVPQEWACCGRPVYDFGMLDLGKRLLRRSLEVLTPYAEQGVPIVGLEPSCVAVFRDELRNLFGDDEAMRVRAEVRTLGEFLQEIDWQPPSIGRQAIMQGHCHHKAIMGMAADLVLARDSGLEAELLDSGCCGMAGPFGFEAGEHYDVSMGAAERRLLPAVRALPDDAFILADGFSCREQVAQATSRRALHLAQALHLGLSAEAAEADGSRPEVAYEGMMAADERWAFNAPVSQQLVAAGGAAALTGLAAWLGTKLRRAWLQRGGPGSAREA